MIINPYIFSAGGGTIIGNVPQTNLSLFLESDFGTTLVSGKVSQWNDKSTNINNAVQTTDSRRPTYSSSDTVLSGLPSLTFISGGADSSMSIPNPLSFNLGTSGFNINIVVYLQGYSLYSVVLQHSDGATWTKGFGILYYNSKLRFFINNYNNVSNYIELNAPALNQKTLINFSWDKTTMKASYRQGGVTISGTKAFSQAYIQPASTDNVSIMTASGGNTSYDTSGKLGAIVVHSYQLSTQDQTSVENYLKSKYGIA